MITYTWWEIGLALHQGEKVTVEWRKNVRRERITDEGR